MLSHDAVSSEHVFLLVLVPFICFALFSLNQVAYNSILKVLNMPHT